MFWNELANGHHYVAAVDGRRGRRLRRARAEPAGRGLGQQHGGPAGPPAPRHRPGAAGGAARHRPRAPAPGTMLLEVAADNAPAQRALRRVRVRGDRRAPGLLPAQQHRRPGDAPGASRDRSSRWCSASRPRATRPASASCAARRCWPTRWRPVWTSTPGSAAWCRRWPAGPTWRRWCRRCSGPWTRPGSRCPMWTPSRSPPGPGWPARCWSGWPRPRATRIAADKPLYGVNHLAAHVAVDTLEHGPLPEPAIALLVSGGHSSLLLRRRPGRRRGAARRDHRRRRRRGVRQGGPAARACRSPAARRSTGRPATATRPRSPSRAA